MAKVKIFADSTCDLPSQLIERHQIGIVPLYVLFNDEIYRDGIDITTPDLFKKVEELGVLPTTAAPSPGDFINAFRPSLDEGYDIVYIGLSSQLSVTLNNARLVAEELAPGRLEVVDSKNLSTGIGLLVLEAVDLVKEGLDAQTIASKIRALTPKVETEFVIDTLDYLYKGGRCSGLAHFMGSMLKIRPSIKVVDGGMVPASKFRGSRAKALQGFLDLVLAKKEDISPKRAFVTNSICSDSPFLESGLLDHTDLREVITARAGCVISSHCGPNSIGILYIRK